VSNQSKKYPLSYAQERLWFLSQIAAESPLYNLQIDVPLLFEVDEALWHRTLAEVVRRHDGLRTVFMAEAGQPYQIVLPVLDFAIPTADLRGVEASDQELAIERIAAEEAQKPFDLGSAPLFRAKLLGLQDDSYLFLLTMHHIITDGWSMDLLTRELALLYEAFASGFPSPLPPLPLQYPEFAVRQRARLAGQALNHELEYWRHQLRNLPQLELPSDFTRPSTPSYRGGYQSVPLPELLVEGLLALSKREGTTLFMTLLAAFQTLMMRYSGQTDIVVGTPIANRNQPETEALIGFFVNTLVIRSDFSGSPCFREVLRRVRETALAAYSNQDLPFEKLVEELQPERDLSRNPLFQVMFVLQTSLYRKSALASAVAYEPLPSSPGNTQYGTSKFDLTLYVVESDVGRSCIFEYSTDVFSDIAITRMMGHWLVLLRCLVATPDIPTTRLPLLTPQERHHLLVERNRTQTDFPRNRTLDELFEETAASFSSAPAINAESGTLTYKELNEQANRLARALRERGVQPNDRIGVSLSRSAAMILAVVAIIKAGGAYVPLDPAYPPPRLQEMARDGSIRCLICSRDSRAAAETITDHLRVPTVDLDSLSTELVGYASDNLEHVTRPETLAYVLYTSGSTGKPKGVCVTHRNVVRLVRNTNFAEFRPEDVFLLFAPLQFDASTFEIWGPLLNGARLEVFPGGLPSLEDLASFIERNGVTTLWLTASLFHQVVDGYLSSLWSVRQLLAGGDVLSPAHCQKVLEHLPQCTLINGYGPTETTTFAACHRMRPGERIGHIVPIGQPISNCRLFVLDQARQLVPIGVPGELYVGGDGVAAGYLNDAELTQARFIPNPFAPQNSSDRLYRTGDVVRYRSDGLLEFLGRLDQQIKIRGYRVETGEIESIASQHPDVREVCVVARDHSGEKQLICYVVPRHEITSDISDEVRLFLQQQLPGHMVPAIVLSLPGFPLTRSGKIDRLALPAPTSDDWSSPHSFVEPQSRLERTIAQIWREVLKTERVGSQDNFFDLGGHSLLLVQVHSRIQEVIGRFIPIIDLFRFPTIQGLAAQFNEVQPSTSNFSDELTQAAEDRMAKQRRARERRALLWDEGRQTS